MKTAVYPSGVDLVIAGAGTGKTRTLAEKAGMLIKNGMDPASILLLTFSRKAAREIRDRVRGIYGDAASAITAGTFHSFCLGFLEDHPGRFIKRFGFGEFPSVLDEDSKRDVLTGIVKGRLDRFLGLPAGVIIQLCEGHCGRGPAIMKKLESSGLNGSINGLKDSYSLYKRKNDLMDFQDMISFACRLMAEDDVLRDSIRDGIHYVLVDEYQDTSPGDFELLNLIMHPAKRNLFSVGDDWQSIYGFRRASVEYTVRMKKYFPEARIHRLSVNYRSRSEIIDLSSRFIRRNRFRTSKKLSSFRGRGGRVNFFIIKNPGEEALVITGIIEKESRPGNEIAVLYRNNWQGEVLSGSLGIDLPSFNVHLMTMHSSKGLEFDTVIIAGISDGIIPDQGAEIEEERRLLYVAMTRARDRLYLIAHFNPGGELSRFARELGAGDYL
ncbi:MAG: ATP-dependent helicase [Spirochaetes bacterium]|nr:ATP-dependent helicase [Spirochaetota bacterium]